MIDLHTHSLFSDGELLPSELVRRLEDMEYSCVAITDHVDSSSLDFVIPRLVKVAKDLNQRQSVRVIPGVEITHVHPEFMESLVVQSRELGAKIVIVHGETIVEPVAKGTNRAAILSRVDILAHPGLIAVEDIKMAAERGVYLEISARHGHCLTNGYVARLAKEFGAKLVLNSDAHSPHDLMTRQFAQMVAQGSGLGKNALEEMLGNSRDLINKIL
ncbi:MAG: PHP domain-containing protein [Deltaproteobacteria bacterium]|nr:MAG: PHP domain-containing protein [Desulfobacterium sp. 4572_20]RLB17804.1 MAG: PHP domain-containing protein [Deltaproteobacteria bacterium]RLB25984.1 MAG: PHP domain-containing protein [Deltaproteobacteria bacterium]HDH87242.1 histidinol phosphate phosphatase domain-containing protein [Desulfobacteraceae bacterium]